MTEQFKTKYRKVFYPHNYKEILSMTGHIFLQLFFAAVIAQINVLLFTWYADGEFLALINKATILFQTIQFIPSLVASGVLVVGGNLVGQGRQKELSKVITTRILVNVIICMLVMVVVETFAPEFLSLLTIPKEEMITVHDTWTFNKLNFTSSYFRINIIQLLLMSVAQVYIAGLQIIKKQKHVAIGAIASNLVDVLVVSMILYVFKLNPLYAALGMPSAALFQLIYMMIINYKDIDYKGQRIGTLLNMKLAKEIVKVGLPITLEMGLWNACNFAMNSAISGLYTNDVAQRTELYNIHSAIIVIINFATVFLQAVATVTSILVAKKIGENDPDGAFTAGVDGWRIAIYGQVILSTLIFALIYPILVYVYGRDADLVIKYGMWLYLIVFVKCIFDTVNMTLLRSLWAVGDLWTPLLISVVTMVLGMVGLPLLISNTFNGETGIGLILIYIVVAMDPISRSIIYVHRWFKKKWFKYVKQM
ncbi:MATE family efflux transporter [[Acholeplasma] multilocale]|uniref:MATE family efflux transporter n=1 Tax=[Acholeplasma] multilocale TaxID=264638 RepID=UPI000479C46A|nr:MATE family efflux transporter [[Acholeplasma] multilocale]